MKNLKLISVLLLLFTFTYVEGQDKIITTQNDTILCRIIYVSPARIAYVLNKQNGNNERPEGKFIPRDQVKDYFQGTPLPDTSQSIQTDKQSTPVVKQSMPGAKQSAIMTESAPATRRPVIIAESMPNAKRTISSESQPVDDAYQSTEPVLRWRVGIQGGGGYLLSSSGLEKMMQAAGVPQPKISDYMKHLQSGMFFGADVHYMITDFLGAGLKYSLFTTSAKLEYILGLGTDYFIPGYSGYTIPTFYSMSEKDKIYVNFIGPSVLFQQRMGAKRQFGFTGELSIGYARYREENRLAPYQYILANIYTNPDPGIMSHADLWAVPLPNGLQQGNTVGGGVRLSFEYYPLTWLSVGVNVGGFYAKFNKLKVSTYQTSDTQNIDTDMSRLDYSLGVTFHF